MRRQLASVQMDGYQLGAMKPLIRFRILQGRTELCRLFTPGLRIGVGRNEPSLPGPGLGATDAPREFGEGEMTHSVESDALEALP